MGSVGLLSKDDSPLAIYSDAVTPSQVPPQGLEPIGGRHTQVSEDLGRVQHVELPESCRTQIRWDLAHSGRPAAVVELFCAAIAEGNDHARSISNT